jgi:hypothetical protein
VNAIGADRPVRAIDLLEALHFEANRGDGPCQSSIKVWLSEKVARGCPHEDCASYP